MHHIAILDDVLLAFDAHLAGLFTLRFAAESDEIIERNHFRSNESFLKIGVNGTGRLRRGRAFVHRPSANFFHARREVSFQPQQRVRRTDHAREARLFHADVVEKNLFVFVRQLGDFRFDLGADSHHRCAFFRRVLLDAVEQGVILKTTLNDIGDVQHRLGGEQRKLFDQREFIRVVPHRAHRNGLIELLHHRFENGDQLDRFLVAGT